MPRTLALAARAAALTPPVLAAALGRLWCAADPGRRRAVARNRRALDAPFPLHAPFTSYVHALAGWLRLLSASRAQVLAASRVEGLEPLLAAARARHGTVLVAAHVGEWEWGAAALAAHGLEVLAVAGTQMSPAWSPALARAKAALGVEVVGPSAARLVPRCARGAVVALLVASDVATARRDARSSAHARRCRSVRPGWRRARARAGRGRERAREPLRRAARRARRRARGRRRERALRAHARWLEATLREAPGAWCCSGRSSRTGREARARHPVLPRASAAWTRRRPCSPTCRRSTAKWFDRS